MLLSNAMPHDYGAYYLQWPMIHKYGHYDTAINDVGAVMGAYPFLFVVLSENMETQDVGMIVNIMAEYTVIVNTTPLGMFPHVDACPDIPYACLTPFHLLYDLLYNPDTTLFMRKGQEHGAVVKNGLEMLLLQAFAAWGIWQNA